MKQRGFGELMALTRTQFVATYSSSSGSQTYYFDVVVDAQGLVSIRNIRGTRGLIQDSMTSIPQSVLEDMESAKAIVIQTTTETLVASGTLAFTGQTYRDATVSAGVLNNTNYRVVYTTSDGVQIITDNPTTTSFRATAGVAYGTVDAPKTVNWVLLVATQQSSTTSGKVTITDSDSSQKTITFATAFGTANYRVVLTPSGFFQAQIINQTKTGFTIQVGYTLQTAETIYVGYDVFV